MKTKKIFTLVLFALMLGMLLGGCGKGGVFVNQIYSGANVGDAGSEYSEAGSELVGAWSYESYYEGIRTGAVIEFLESGDVNLYSIVGETAVLYQSGTYVVKNDTIVIYSEDDPDGEDSRFTLENGVLTLIEDGETLELTPYNGELDKNSDISDILGGITDEFGEGENGLPAETSGIVGNWKCVKTQGETTAILEMAIRADGTMTAQTTVNNVVTNSSSADYEIVGNKIIAYVGDDTEGDPAYFNLNGDVLTITTEDDTEMVFFRVD